MGNAINGNCNNNFAMPWAGKESLIYLARQDLPEKVGAMARRREWLGQKRVRKKLNLVNNPILRSMMEIFTNGSIVSTGSVVVYAIQGMGKTMAATAVLEAAEAGIMFHGSSGGIPYWKRVAISLGMPRSLEIADGLNWVDVFVDAVNNYNLPLENGNDTEANIFAVANACSHQDSLLIDVGFDTNEVLLGDDVVAAFPPEVPGPYMQNRGKVVIFDDFNNVTQDDYAFIYAVFRRMADYTPNLMSFVMTSQENVANDLLDMNAWIKMAPAPGTFVSDIDPDRPTSNPPFPHPSWEVQWTANELRNFVVVEFGEHVASTMTFRDGQTPSAVKKEQKLKAEDVDQRSHFIKCLLLWLTRTRATE